MNDTTTTGQAGEHPGDVYAKAEIESWYAQRRRHAEAELRRATVAGARIAAYGEADDQDQAQDQIRRAQAVLDEVEASYQQWSTYGTMPPDHSARVSRVIGSIGGGLVGAFGPPVTVTASEQAWMELGLDPSIEPGSQLLPALESGLGLAPSDPTRPPTEYQLADHEYRARWSVGVAAMRRMGLYCDGDPWPAQLHARYARECAEEDERRVAGGWDPVNTEDVLAAVQHAVGEPVTVLAQLPGRYTMDEAGVRDYCRAAHWRLVESAATVVMIVARFVRRVNAGAGMTEAERHTAGLALADLIVAAEAIAQAAARSTGVYAKVLENRG